MLGNFRGNSSTVAKASFTPEIVSPFRASSDPGASALDSHGSDVKTSTLSLIPDSYGAAHATGKC